MNHISQILKQSMAGFRRSKLGVFMGAALMLSASAGAQTYQTIAVTGYNADVIADGPVFAGSVNADVDGGGFYFLNQSFTANGVPTAFLPNSGLVNSAATAGLSFQMAAANANNSLRFNANTTASLNFVTPQSAGILYLMATSGSGASVMNVTVNFTDNTTQVFNNLSVADWFGGAPVVVQGFGRTSATALEAPSGNPRLYQVPLALTGVNLTKSISSISITRVSGGVLNVMGVSAALPCVAPVSQPSALVLTAAGVGQINGSFTAAAGADQYLVVRYPAGGTATAPVAGVNYTVGASLGAGVVVGSGAATSFTASSLAGNTAYDFYVYAFNSTACIGPVYQLLNPLQGSQTTSACGGPSGVVTVGPTGTFNSLTQAFTSISTTGISSSVIFELEAAYNSTVETFPIVIGANGCANASRTITIRPAAGATALSITGSNAGATIDLNGARYVTIDGRPGGTGSVGDMRIINTNAAGNAIRFVNDAQFNTVTYCDVQAQNTTAPSNPATQQAGAIYFGSASTTGLQGNDNNTISFCSIHSTPGNNLTMGILASTGTIPATDGAYNDNNTITGNNIYDVFAPASQFNFLKLDVGSNAWTITNNHFYQTLPRTVSASNTHRAIWISTGTNSTTTGNGFVVTGNFIGGGQASAGGNAFTINGNFGTVFYGMDISVSLATAASIQNNTITNFNITTNIGSSPSGFMGISQNQGNMNIGTVTGNIIGSPTATGAITVTSTTTTTSLSVYGIRVSGGTTPTVNIANNSIGGITTIGSGTIALGITGIHIAAGTNITVNNNTIGSTTTANSLNASSATTGLQSVIGINAPSLGTGTLSFTNNTIANLNNNYTGTGNGLTQGISVAASGTPVIGAITGNTIRNLSSSSNSVGSGANAAIVGINMQNTNAAGVNVSGNTIHSLSVSAATAAVQVTGLFFNASSNTISNISRNFIHSFDVISANAATTLTGIDYSNGTANVVNNMIRLGIRPSGNALTNEAVIRGISSNSSTAANNYYFNTIYIGGTGVGTTVRNSFAITRSASGGSFDIRNNILVNNRSNATTGGKHYVLFFTTNTNGTIGNYNIYQNAGTGAVFANNGTADLAQYTTGWISGDVNSIIGDPLLVAATGSAAAVNLHLASGSPAEGAGVAIATVTEDFDGELRSSLTPTDIGADAGNYAVTGIDVGVSGLVAPSMFSCFSNTQVITVSLKNYSSNAINFSVNPVTVTVSIPTGTGSPYSSNIVLNTGTLAAGASQNVTLPATLDMSAAGSYTFNAVATVTGDVNAVNNSMTPETRTVAAGGALSGSYNVGAGQGATGGFETLTAAVAAYNAANCISGNVVFNLTSATYSTAETFPIVINANPYAGSFTLTIRPAAGNAAAITGTSGTTASALIRLNGADNVIIDGINSGGASLSIENTSITGGTAAIWLSSVAAGNGATGNIIRNLTIRGGSQQNNGTVATYGIVMAGGALNATPGSMTAGNDNDNNLIEGNTILKVRYGIYTMGGAPVNPNTGTIIRNNTIGSSSFGVDQIGRAGILVREEDGIQITGNEIRYIGGDFANSPTTGIDRVGIGLATDATWTPTSVMVRNARITANNIHDIVEERTFSAVGVSIGAADGSNYLNNIIANNFIWNIKANGTGTDQAVGIGINAGNGNRVLYNTIYMTGDTDPAAGATTPSVSNFGISISSTAVLNPEIRNNIVWMDLVSSSAPALRNAAMNIPASFNWGTGASTNNDLYIEPTNTQANIGSVGGTFHATLPAYATASGQEASSISVKPVFIGATNFHLVGGLNFGINNQGVAVSGVTTDIDGDTRSSTPDIGADEFSPPVGVDIAASQMIDPAVKNCYGATETVRVSIRNVSANTIDFANTPVVVTVGISGVVTASLTTTVNTGLLPSGDSLIVVLPATVDMSAPGSYVFDVSAVSLADANTANNTLPSIIRTVIAPAAGSISANNSSFCVSGTPTLTLTGNAGGSIQWQESSSATGPWTNVGTGASTFTPAAAITATTFYQVVISCNANSVTTTPITITVNAPSVTASTPGNRCGPGTVVLAATASAGATLNWYSAPTGGTAIGTGASFTTPVINATTTYYVAASAGAGCESVRQAVVATINVGPAFDISNNLTICNNAIQQLTLITPAANFDSYVWTPSTNLFTDAAATLPYTGGSATTVYIRNATAGTFTYIVNAQNSTTQCSGIDSVKVTVLPAAVTINATASQLCNSGSVTLSLSPANAYTGASFQWQSSPNGTTYTDISGATAATYTTPTINATTFYRVIISNSAAATCLQPTRTITVLTPSVVSNTPASNCGPGALTLTATGSTGSTLNWYTTATGGLPVATGGSYTTPTLTNTTTYYVSATSGGAVASLGPVSPTASVVGGLTTSAVLTNGLLFDVLNITNGITVQSVDIFPTSPVGTPFTILVRQGPSTSGSILFSYTGVTTVTGTTAAPVAQTVPLNLVLPAGFDYVMTWGTAPVSMRNTTVNGYPFTIPGEISINNGTPGGTWNYFYNWRIGTGCESPRVPVTATINTPTVINTQPVAQTICSGTTLNLSVGATGSGLSYQWLLGGNPIAGATSASYSVPNVTTAASGNYSVTVTGICGTLSSNTVLVTVNGSNTWLGVVNSDWNNPANWCGPVPTATTDVVIPATAPIQPVVNGTAQVRNLTINTGASVTTSASAQFNIYGNLTINGSYNATNGFTFFRGATPQTVSALTASNVVINGTGGVVLAGAMNVTTLVLQNGNITLGTQHLTVGSSVNGAVASHVITNGTGTVTSNNIAATPVIIPVGPDAASYNPVMITNGQGRNYTVRVSTGITPAITDNARAVNRTWNVTASGTVATPVSLTFQFDDLHGNAQFNSNGPLEVGYNNGTSWNVATPPNGVMPLGGSTERQVTHQSTVFGNFVVTRPGGITYITSVPNVSSDITRMVLMPNAVQAQTVLRIQSKRAMRMQFIVVDASGRVVRQFSANLVTGINDLRLNFSELKAGMYFINGRTDKGKDEVLKFIRL